MTDFPEVFTVAEVAVRLRCSKAHVCNAINGRVKGVTPLPAVRMGRRKLIRATALANWLAENDPSDVMILASSGIGAVDASKGRNDA